MLPSSEKAWIEPVLGYALLKLPAFSVYQVLDQALNDAAIGELFFNLAK